jgi:predicted nucleotidyltransferase
MQQIIENKLDTIKSICRSFGVEKLHVFGSVVSDNFMQDSDIDFLISFNKNLSVEEYTENYFALQYKLRDLFDRDIDIVTERTLNNPYFIESIEETKWLIHEA